LLIISNGGLLIISIMSKIIFAGGCFWGVQHYFQMVKGVTKTEVGYIGGHLNQPTYKQVKTGTTGHTEACLVNYDNTQTSLTKLLVHFFFIIDPTAVNRQANDIGTQYRTGIFFYTAQEKDLIQKYINEQVVPKYKNSIAVQIDSAMVHQFWPAEEYHQHYLEKNPDGYCHLTKDTYNRCRFIDIDNSI
jgi:methionine-S-sulfoxide reductase